MVAIPSARIRQLATAAAVKHELGADRVVRLTASSFAELYAEHTRDAALRLLSRQAARSGVPRS
jgi:hypothetical protein